MVTQHNDRLTHRPIDNVARLVPDIPGGPACATADLKAYIADMLLELHEMAEQSGLKHLSGRLASAYIEARQPND